MRQDLPEGNGTHDNRLILMRRLGGSGAVHILCMRPIPDPESGVLRPGRQGPFPIRGLVRWTRTANYDRSGKLLEDGGTFPEFDGWLIPGQRDKVK